MPDNTAPNRSDSSAPGGRANLPVPVSHTNEGVANRAAAFVGQLLRTVFRWKPASLRKNLEVVLEEATAESGFTLEERLMLRNVLRLRGRRVEDIMTPRADIVAVQQDIDLGELIKVIEGAAHSRLVVYNDTLDDPVGMVHIRDLIAYMAERATVVPKPNAKRRKTPPGKLDLRAVDLTVPLASTKIVRQMLFVPPSMAATDLFGKMQATRIHLALVIDEYGGTDGLISIEDIVEQVVGEIEDEHDEDVPLVVVRQPDGSFLADARASIEEVSAALGTEFDVGLSDEVDTLGGYLFKKIGRIPVRGELVAGPGDFEMEVADADPRRVKKVKITRRKEKPAPDAPGVPAASETVASSSGTPAAPEAPGGKPGETPSDPGP